MLAVCLSSWGLWPKRRSRSAGKRVFRSCLPIFVGTLAEETITLRRETCVSQLFAYLRGDSGREDDHARQENMCFAAVCLSSWGLWPKRRSRSAGKRVFRSRLPIFVGTLAEQTITLGRKTFVSQLFAHLRGDSGRENDYARLQTMVTSSSHTYFTSLSLRAPPTAARCRSS